VHVVNGISALERRLVDTLAVGSNRTTLQPPIRYAKADVNDILVKVIAVNVSDTEETLHVIPQLWFRNTWSFNATEDLKHIAKPHVGASARALSQSVFVLTKRAASR